MKQNPQHTKNTLFALGLSGLLILNTLTLAYGTPREAMMRDPLDRASLIEERVIIEAIGESSEKAPQSLEQTDSRELTLAHSIWRYNRTLSSAQSQYLAHYILKFSRFYQLDYKLVAGMIAVESAFRPNAVSSSGAIGLGQLKPATARWLGVNNPYHPADNIAGMTRYLKYLLNKYQGDYARAIVAYYQGPGSVDRQGIASQSRPYLKKVEKAVAQF